MNKRNFSRFEIIELLENPVEHDSDTSYRHGAYEHYVCMHEGKYWSFTLVSSPNEGLDIQNITEAIEVRPIEAKTIAYVTVQNSDGSD